MSERVCMDVCVSTLYNDAQSGKNKWAKAADWKLVLIVQTEIIKYHSYDASPSLLSFVTITNLNLGIWAVSPSLCILQWHNSPSSQLTICEAILIRKVSLYTNCPLSQLHSIIGWVSGCIIRRNLTNYNVVYYLPFNPIGDNKQQIFVYK